MKKARLLLIVGTLALVSCDSTGTRVEQDAGGSGEFYVTNRASFPIRIIMTMVPQLTGGTDTSSVIPCDSTVLVLTDYAIGMNVTPVISFHSLSIMKADSLYPKTVYHQSPIDESRWLVEKQYTGDFGLTVSTFVFTDSLVERICGTLSSGDDIVGKWQVVSTDYLTLGTGGEEYTDSANHYSLDSTVEAFDIRQEFMIDHVKKPGETCFKACTTAYSVSLAGKLGWTSCGSYLELRAKACADTLRIYIDISQQKAIAYVFARMPETRPFPICN